jgi:hypothetical protein
MEHNNGYTEQCNDWSEHSTTRINGYVAYATAPGCQATAHPQPPGAPRLLDHALHALWQTPLPLCDWTRAWPQILSLGEQSQTTSHAHLCPATHGGAGAGAVGPAADVSHALRGAVRHWLPVADTTRGQVARSHGVGQLGHNGVCDRRDGRQSTRGQYVGTRGERSSLAQAVTGGSAPCTRR